MQRKIYLGSIMKRKIRRAAGLPCACVPFERWLVMALSTLGDPMYAQDGKRVILRWPNGTEIIL